MLKAVPHNAPLEADNSLEGRLTFHFHIYLNLTVIKTAVPSAGLTSGMSSGLGPQLAESNSVPSCGTTIDV
ncbi:hypothetical protein F7725_020326, partial [Dissostichus mawsoni]